MNNGFIKIRKAVLADVKGIAKVHVDSWKTTYTNIIPEEYLNNLTYESREQIWKNNIPNGDVYVAENSEGQIVGSISNYATSAEYFEVKEHCFKEQGTTSEEYYANLK